MAASGVVAAAAAGTRGKRIATQVDNFAGDVFSGGGLGNDFTKLQGGSALLFNMLEPEMHVIFMKNLLYNKFFQG